MSSDAVVQEVVRDRGRRGNTRSPSRQRLRLGLIIVGSWAALTLVYVVSPVKTNGDSYLTLHTAHSLAYQRDLDLSEFMNVPTVREHYGLTTVDGHPVSYFPWTTSVFMIPFVVGWDALSTTGLVSNSQDLIAANSTDLIQQLSASAISAAAAVVLAMATAAMFKGARRNRREPNSTQAITGWDPEGWWFIPATTLVIGLTTTLWSTASRAMWQHAPSILMLGIALLCIASADGSGRHRRLLGVLAGASLGVSYWARPTNAVLVLALVAYVVWQYRQWTVNVAAGLAVSWLGMLVLNLVLLGVAFPPYYASGRVGLHSAYAEAVAASLLSPARGVLFFSPFALLALVLLLPSRCRLLPKPQWRLSLAVIGGSVLYVLLVAGYGDQWWGGHSYGPRFVSEPIALLTPFALLAAFGPRLKSSATTAISIVIAPLLIVYSGFVHGEGAFTKALGCWSTYPVNIDKDPSRIWDLNDPEFLLGARLIVEHGPLGAHTAACDRHRKPML